MLVGAVGVIAVQVLLVWGYLAVNGSDPIILNPDRRLDRNGPSMMMVCGLGNDKDVLDTVEGGEYGMWTPGRVVKGDCEIYYHHKVGYRLYTD